MISSVSTTHREQTSPAIKILANFFSWIFHPLFIGLYMCLYIVYLQPDYFMGVSKVAKLQTVLIYVVNSIFFPLISVLLCKALGFINSIYLKTRKDRILLYTICMIYFFWNFYVFKNKEDIPAVMAIITLGIFLATVMAFLANIYFKISMHATGVGGLIGFFTVLLYLSPGIVSIPFAFAVLIAGITCTSRLLVSDHNMADIILGLMAGFISQWIAAWFLG
ncbi:MAG: hypothetical protein IT249_19205 [Chitinophagaceae bacterium]|nr:hypothetical protein [Chitinophagaceae bacterium]